jgi:hypothetical protein
MDASLYTLEMDDWPLFGGQLLTVPDTPTVAELSGHVLQDWSLEPAGQLVTTSPSVELLQDSIWPDVTCVEESSDSASLWRAKDILPIDFALRPISSIHFSFSNDVLNDFAADDFPLASDGSQDVYAYDSQNISPIDVKFEYGNVFSGQAALENNLFPNNQYLYQPSTTSSNHSEVSVDLQAYQQNEPFVDSVPQEVPHRFYSDLDSFDCDSDSLRDPENVYKILKQLSDGSNSISLDMLSRRPILSLVSPEEVESVLSRDSPADSEARRIQLNVCSPVERVEMPVYDSDASSAVLMQDYLRRDVTLKAESSRSSSPAEPYGCEPKPDRRLKKKEQNKTAALRYRHKKREEKGVVLTEVEELELKNGKLKARADDLTREINYLRGLLDEIKKQ